mmetsp:Transcript_85519/g.104940  ORF Transcript_85519/g.104940 Transcript_85519/m.104940 type:complete len:258 (-) Transcript_85519:288-1061(-)
MVVQRPVQCDGVVSIGRQQCWIGAAGLQKWFHVRRFHGIWWGRLHGVMNQHGRRSWHCFIFRLLFTFFIKLLVLVLLLALPHIFGLKVAGILLDCARGIHVAHQRHPCLVHRDTPWTAHQNVLGLQVRVDDAANSMQVIQANQGVRCHLADDLQRNAFEIVPLDESKDIWTHGLKDHAYVLPIDTKVFKVVDQLNYTCEAFHASVWEELSQRSFLSFLPCCIFASFGCLGQKLDFIIGGFGVVRSTFLYLHGDVARG